MKRLALLLLLLVSGPAWADAFHFETPSGNIDCSVGLMERASEIYCTIHERQGPPAQPMPAGCDGDWGHNFFMENRGPVSIVCEPKGPNYVAGEIADYGVTGRFGGFACASSQQGLECRNEDGHGFFLSRAAQRVF